MKSRAISPWRIQNYPLPSSFVLSWFRHYALAPLIALGIMVPALPQGTVTNSYVNFETAPVHPIALSPDQNYLAVANLPDGRVEVFDAQSGSLSPLGSIPVGIDPVTVRFRTTNELWVVNTISDSINIIELPSLRVVSSIDTLDAPADVIFAGTAERGFVTCATTNVVQMIDVNTRRLLGLIRIDGDRPKAMAVSPDHQKVYVAIFESGNSSTVLGGDFTGLNSLPPATVVDFPVGPHGGQNPPPNAGTNFFPAINPAIPTTNPPPRVSLIVKKNQSGRWMDDNNGDWTEYVSGTNSFFTSRTQGWDISDNDMVEIDANTFTVAYARTLMNICTDLAVNPANGRIAMIGTDAANEIRFEPVQKGVFVKSMIAQVSPGMTDKLVRDLNPHLDYKTNSLPLAQKLRTVGDPRGIIWNSSGTVAYVAGMGSNNILLLDADGHPLEPNPVIAVDDGPSGLALDEQRNRLYVYHRFANSVWVIDTASLTKIQSIPLHDPTPDIVKKGRQHFYNTRDTSGLGQAACASCHVDARFDRLAWDLGTPLGSMVKVDATTRNFSRFPPTEEHDFHPMKGPMVTQSLQDVIGHEPFHWRGDRDGIEAFNGTFTNLQAAPSSLATNEMVELKRFLSTIRFPPNPYRTFSNTLPSFVNLPSAIFPVGLRDEPTNTTMIGSPNNGMNLFRQQGAAGCIHCHSLPAGLGAFMTFTNLWRAIPDGTNGEKHVALIGVRRSDFLPFKIPSLRNIFDKIGLTYQKTISRGGFGFSHDGTVDTLPRFLQDSLQLATDEQTADVVAFLFCLTGSDLPPGALSDPDRPPGLPSNDAHAAVGKQIVLAGGAVPSFWTNALLIVQPAASRVDLIVKGNKDGRPRGWVFDRGSSSFRSDRLNEFLSSSNLLALASPTNPLIVTVVSRESGTRLGIDRDEDGFPDQTELDAGSDPANPNSVPITNVSALRAGDQLDISWNSSLGKTYHLQFKTNLESLSWIDLPESVAGTGKSTKIREPIVPGQTARYYRILTTAQ